jgi:hypothetical protein
MSKHSHQFADTKPGRVRRTERKAKEARRYDWFVI